MFAASGHVYVLRSANGGLARIQTPSYIATEGLCIELYYWVEKVGTLQLVLIGEDETKQNRTDIVTVINQWGRFFTQLSNGTFVVTIDGSGPNSWVVIDDIWIEDCESFRKLSILSYILTLSHNFLIIVLQIFISICTQSDFSEKYDRLA